LRSRCAGFFLREIILGQLITQAKKFAEAAYAVIVEKLVLETMKFFTSGVRNQGSGRSLEDFMAAYENENGKKFDELLALKQSKQKTAAKEATEKFQTLTKTSPEEFLDFRIAQRFLTKETYVSMYVGIAIIEATPLVEAMMVPLMDNGAKIYGAYFDSALKFYRNPLDDDKDDPLDIIKQVGELRWREHGPTWEFWKNKEWIAYEKDDQTLIETAYTDGRKEISLQISKETYRLNWEGPQRYQINEKTKSVRKIRRKSPERTKSPEDLESPESSKKPDLIVRRKRFGCC